MALTLGIEDVAKSYQGKPVLSGCCMSFGRGGVYVLMGDNGSGKSTLLRISALLESPDRGRIVYSDGKGELPHDLSLRRRMTLVLPRIGAFNTTVFRNAAYGLKVRGAGREVIEGKVRRSLEFVKLWSKRDQNALTLSSGETQRLGMARALVLDPEFLFLDEPTASIDRENTGIIEEIIMSLKNGKKVTIVIATHDATQAERLADRMLILENGKITER